MQENEFTTQIVTKVIDCLSKVLHLDKKRPVFRLVRGGGDNAPISTCCVQYLPAVILSKCVHRWAFELLPKTCSLSPALPDANDGIFHVYFSIQTDVSTKIVKITGEIPTHL